MRVLDLFSGIGGFALGLERAGFETAAFCELDPYCREVLRTHWKGIPVYEDITTLTADQLRRDGVGDIRVLAGGFPCQDLSYAGRRAGITGSRSGLWGHYARLIDELRPQYAIMENVPGLLSSGHGRVLGDLASLGYDAWWDCIPASAVGAPHQRDRVWIVAYSNAPHSQGDGLPSGVHAQHAGARVRREDVAHAKRGRRQGSGLHEDAIDPAAGAAGEAVEPVDGGRSKQRRPQRRLGGMADGISDWSHEPSGIPRVIKGQENRPSRLKALGNAVVPRVVEVLGRAIMRSVA